MLTKSLWRFVRPRINSGDDDEHPEHKHKADRRPAFPEGRAILLLLLHYSGIPGTLTLLKPKSDIGEYQMGYSQVKAWRHVMQLRCKAMMVTQTTYVRTGSISATRLDGTFDARQARAASYLTSRGLAV